MESRKSIEDFLREGDDDLLIYAEATALRQQRAQSIWRKMIWLESLKGIKDFF